MLTCVVTDKVLRQNGQTWFSWLVKIVCHGWAVSGHDGLRRFLHKGCRMVQLVALLAIVKIEHRVVWYPEVLVNWQHWHLRWRRQVITELHRLTVVLQVVQILLPGHRHGVRAVHGTNGVVVVLTLQGRVPAVRSLGHQEGWPRASLRMWVDLVMALLQQHSVRDGNAVLLESVQR